MDIQNIPLSSVKPSPMNPRKTFDQASLEELAESIEKQGLHQPIIVRPKEKVQFHNDVTGETTGGVKTYEVVCGERRYRAYSLLSEKWKDMDAAAPDGQSCSRFSSIPAIVREMTDDEAFEAMITENLQRKDVDPMEEAFAFGQLIKNGRTAEEIALRFGKSIRFVQDRCKLNALIPELMVAVKDEKMSIAAAMIISKLDEEHQRHYHSSYSNNPRGFTRDTAESYTQSLFMAIDCAPWYQTDDQEDEDFDGGCGRSCASCTLNTANHGCLFWDMKTDDAGKCTDRKMFYRKHCAYILKELEDFKDRLVAIGSPLESGKTVIIDVDDWCSAGTKKLKESVYESIRAHGFEVVKADDIFSGKCFYGEDDDRLKRKIEQGKVFRCLKIFQYDNVAMQEEYWYFKGGNVDDDDTAPKSGSSAASPQSVEAMKLMQKRNRLKEAACEKIAAQEREMAKNLREAMRAGELSDAELLAFDIIIFTLCGSEMQERYGHKGYGKPSDRSLVKVIMQNQADRPKWIREFIRNVVSGSETSYNGLYQFSAGEVSKEGKPKEFSEMVRAISEKLDKDLQKNAEKLRELGYDTDGKLLSKA